MFLVKTAVALSLAALAMGAAAPRWQVGQAAPSFTLPGAAGKPLSLAGYKGRRVLLVFERFVGCPICNLHVHELIARLPALRQAGIEPVVIYESDPALLARFALEEKLDLTLLADPDGALYDAYGVGTSLGGMMSGMFSGDMGRARAGGKLYKGSYKRDGHLTRLVADFLIGPDGRFEQVHYGSTPGDHLPLDNLTSSCKPN